MTQKKLRLLREHIVSIGEIINELIDDPDKEPETTATVSYSDPTPTMSDLGAYRHDPTLVITDVQDAGRALVRGRKKEWVSDLLNNVFDATRISDLKRGQWEEFIDLCNAELGEGSK